MSRSGAGDGRELSFDGLVGELRPFFHRKITGEATDPSKPEDLAEVLAQLLAFGCAVEALLQRSARRGRPAPPVPIRSLVEQVLSGEGMESAAQRLTGYFKEAIAAFAQAHADVESRLDDFSRRLSEGLGPARIKDQAKVTSFQKLFGLQEIAYWREFCQQFQLVDPDAMRDLAGGTER